MHAFFSPLYLLNFSDFKNELPWLIQTSKTSLKIEKMSNPFSDVSYEELLKLHREEKQKNDEHIRELIAILNRVLNEIFVFFLLKMKV